MIDGPCLAVISDGFALLTKPRPVQKRALWTWFAASSFRSNYPAESPVRLTSEIPRRQHLVQSFFPGTAGQPLKWREGEGVNGDFFTPTAGWRDRRLASSRMLDPRMLRNGFAAVRCIRNSAG
jgi:hypothetical protein